MTNQHPLTDEIIRTQDWPDRDDGYGVLYDEDGLRAAADWQLEQVIRWAKLNCWCWFEKSSSKKSFIVELQKAMRPQQQDDN